MLGVPISQFVYKRSKTDRCLKDGPYGELIVSESYSFALSYSSHLYNSHDKLELTASRW